MLVRRDRDTESPASRPGFFMGDPSITHGARPWPGNTVTVVGLGSHLPGWGCFIC